MRPDFCVLIDMMGSKADMISAKIDEVSRNEIWREHVHKEDGRKRDNAPFQMNPNTLATIAVKPTQIDPTRMKGSTEEEKREIAALEKKLQRRMQSLTETEANEVGHLDSEMYNKDRVRTNRRWYKGKASCDITLYADAYTTMSGQNPFSDKGSR
jgi:hypothetical protein